MSVHHNHYAPSAYRSSQHAQLVQDIPVPSRWAQRHNPSLGRRKMPRGLLLNNAQFAALDFDPEQYAAMQDYLAASTEQQAELLEGAKEHRAKYQFAARSWIFWLSIFRFWALCAMVISPPFMIIFELIANPVEEIEPFNEGFILMVYLPIGAFIFFHFVHKWYQSYMGDRIYDKAISFNRETGMVYHPKAPKGFKRRSFAEYDAYYTKIVYSSGVVYYRMSIVHRTAKIIIVMSDYNSYWRMLLDWQSYQSFMDIEQPLVDIPGMELLRPYDPTTVAYDAQTKRQSDYWWSKDWETIQAIRQEHIQDVKAILAPFEARQDLN